MRKFQSAALAAALTATTALGLAAAGATANAKTAAAEHATRPVTASRCGSGAATVAANEREVRAFLHDVIDEHHGDQAGRFLTSDMQWHGGTVGTVKGRTN